MFWADQSPLAPERYVGIPLSAEIPAPVRTTTERTFLRIEAASVNDMVES